jgi:metal-responsive CopG/Arc/MetJ family transcriptional regulator
VSRKVLVTMEEKVLALLDEAAAERGVSRSALLNGLVEDALAGPTRSAEAAAALRRLRAMAEEHPPPTEDPTATIRRMRDAR